MTEGDGTDDDPSDETTTDPDAGVETEDGSEAETEDRSEAETEDRSEAETEDRDETETDATVEADATVETETEMKPEHESGMAATRASETAAHAEQTTQAEQAEQTEHVDQTRVRTKGAIIVGASSGIGEALARELAADGYEIGLAARRTERLTAIGEELPTQAYVATMDVTDTEDARVGFFELVDAMPSVDLVIISAGVGHVNSDLEWGPERETVDVNVRGFTAIATAALEYFELRAASAPDRERAGHLVGISSVAALFGNGGAPAYNASKAFVSTYLEGLRYRQAGRETDVTITTVEPGFVDTELASGEFWMCSPETAATQIARAIRKERTHVYVTRRWRLVAWFLKAMPEVVLRRFFT